MLNLKVKHKLLAIWLGSILFALVLMAGLFQYQVAGLHQQEARTAISGALDTLHKELEGTTIRIRSSADSLAARGDVVASMNMINRYQDPNNYQGAVFDGEKQKLARELAQHASATSADILAVYDSKDLLAAFYLSPRALGLGAGYVVFDKGVAQVVTLSAPSAAQRDIPSLFEEILPHSKEASVISYTKDEHLALSTQATIVRKTVSGEERIVGTMLVGKVLEADFQSSMSRLVGMEFRIIPPGGRISPPLPGIDATSLDNGIASLRLDSIINHPEGLKHTWFSTDEYSIGAVKLVGHDNRDVGIVFAQRKDTLESTLTTFQQSITIVLILSGLLVLPIGIYFLNRTITRPIENLVIGADQLRQGQPQNLEAFTGRDEFSELAHAFQDMATAVQARESALRDSQKSLKNAQRIARLGSWEWDTETDVVRCSEEVHAILGCTQQRLGGDFKAFMACVHPDDARTLQRRMNEAIETGEAFSVEHRIVLPDGRERFVIENGEIHRHEDRQGVQITATMQDITERHQLEQAKSELISTVSHELRTPLTSIIGTLGLAVGGVMGELPDRLRGMLATADKNAKRLSALIDDLLDVEKLSSGSMQFEFRPITVAPFMRKAQAANQSYAQAMDATIRIVGDLPDATIYGDADRLAQVMANLLSNACKFTPPGGQVELRADHDIDAGTITLSVTDFGPGIPEKFEDQIFSRFAQADQSLTRTDQRGGTGLGLAISQSIAGMHDGRISFTTVRAPTPGHGTTFTVTLPEWREE